jgi:hypothetical protein
MNRQARTRAGTLHGDRAPRSQPTSAPIMGQSASSG